MIVFSRMIITFLYRVHGVTGRSYGKFIGKTPSYEEGLDRALAGMLFPVFQQVYGSRVREVEDISVGVLVVDREAKDYYSEGEKELFDLLFCQWSNQPAEIFVEGKAISLKGI